MPKNSYVRSEELDLDPDAIVIQPQSKPCQHGGVSHQNNHGTQGTGVEGVQGQIDQAGQQIRHEKNGEAVGVEDAQDAACRETDFVSVLGFVGEDGPALLD